MKRIVITPTMYNGNERYNTYLKEINKFNLSEDEIIKRIENGDNDARQLLITNNLRFVITVAKQYLNHGAKLPDLISDGNLGLVLAAQKYDPSTGFKFISYAVWWIRAKILENLQMNINVVRTPSNKIQEMGLLNKKLNIAEQELGEELTYSKALSIFPEDHNLLDLVFSIYGKKDSSLDANFNDDDDSGTLLDLIPNEEDKPDDIFFKNETKEILELLINKLTGYNKKVIELYFGLNDTIPCIISQIADRLNLTVYDVEKRLKNSLKELKDSWNVYNTRKHVILKKQIKTPSIFENPLPKVIKTKVIQKPLPKVIQKPLPKVIQYTDITKKENTYSNTLTEQEQNILDHLYGAFTGVKSSNGEVARKLNISKLDVIAAVKKYKTIYG